MASEVSYRDQYPYYAITYISVTFPDGTQIQGTGALVGPNDILTATHLVYSPANGGWASRLEVSAGADLDASSNAFDASATLALSQEAFQIHAWPDQVYADWPDELLTSTESQYDVALIGLNQALGTRVGGWFGIAPERHDGVWAWQLGYPAGASGMMQGQAWVQPQLGYEVYEARLRDGSDIFGPGSSGGPLYVYVDGQPQIIGVKSAGSQDLSIWASVGWLYDELQAAIADNDSLLAGTPLPVDPRYDQAFQATSANEVFIGGAGLDAVYYDDWSLLYRITRQGDRTEVEPLQAQAGHDTLFGIERIVFNDRAYALDVDVWQTAGSAYRLYQAAFGRTPDPEGLSYWIGEMDRGHTLAGVAADFVASDEFLQHHGRQPNAAALVDGYYVNILGRVADPGGRAYWLNEYQTGSLDAASLLMYLSESPENLQRVGAVIDDGIWLA